MADKYLSEKLEITEASWSSDGPCYYKVWFKGQLLKVNAPRCGTLLPGQFIYLMWE